MKIVLKGKTYDPLSSSAAHLPSLIIGKAGVGSGLAAVRRRRGRRRRWWWVAGAGSDHSNDSGKSGDGELHDERVVW